MVGHQRQAGVGELANTHRFNKLINLFSPKTNVSLFTYD
jgi:hypothetical protein